MATIDIGPGANLGTSNMIADYTTICKDNPANNTGTLDSFETYATININGFKIGTFYGTGTSIQVRDYESIGYVASGSKQTFTGKNCDVTSGDILGFYFSSGMLSETLSGNGRYYVSGDKFGGGSNTYLEASYYDACYATGETAAVGSLLTNLFKKPFRHMLIR
jgi:hypothetical protein